MKPLTTSEIKKRMKTKTNEERIAAYDIDSNKPLADFLQLGVQSMCVRKTFANKPPCTYREWDTEIPGHVQEKAEKFREFSYKNPHLATLKDCRKLHKMIKPMLGKQNDSCHIEGVVDVDGVTYFDQKKKDELIATHLRKQVASEIWETIPMWTDDQGNLPTDFVTEEQVSKAWDQVNPDKAMAKDLFNIKYIKPEDKPRHCTTIAKRINKLTIAPYEAKALVMMLSKKGGSVTTLDNSRGISMFSHLQKISGKTINKEMMKSKLLKIRAYQNGFMPGRSC